MENLVREVAGENYNYAWTGEAYQETQSGTTISLVLIFAIVMTLLVLAAQYESWTDPVAVIMAMPTALLGTVMGCIFLSQSISIYTQIGIILLLGLAAKNAILIVEFAKEEHERHGLSVKDAAIKAAKLRFRAIMMTELAFIIGVMPMIFASGAGANSRISVGSTVLGGMMAAATLGAVLTPAFYVIVQEFVDLFPKKEITEKDLEI